MFNAREYIDRYLVSVYSQRYPIFEVIVVNDGSVDDSGSFIRSNYPEVNLIEIPNGGVAAARNRGVYEARGEYIAFIDADDVWMEDKLEYQMRLFSEKDSLALVFCDNYFVSESGVKRTTNKSETIMDGDIVINIFKNSELCTSTVVVVKEVSNCIGGFDERLVAAEDDNLWLKIAYGYEIGCIDKMLVDVYMREESLSRGAGVANIYNGVTNNLKILE